MSRTLSLTLICHIFSSDNPPAFCTLKFFASKSLLGVFVLLKRKWSEINQNENGNGQKLESQERLEALYNNS